jgi:OFA family oxalate/formate antiporter-like MFS transporter
MIFPPEDWRPDGYAPPQGSDQEGADGAFTSGEMLRTSQYYLILLTFAISASAGLMTIGLMKLFPIQALTGAGMDPAAASAIAGTAMAVCFSLANGVGRIAWGTLSDRIGRKASIILMMSSQGAVVILFQWMAGQEHLLYLGATIIGFNFGGNFALFPTVTADTFGSKYIGQNYGWVFLAYGLGGIIGPVLGGRLGDLNNYPLAFTICGALCFVAVGIIGALEKPAKP